ncbi:MAG TPA: acyl-ACP--UDP-N-acetylglucosamine O-acyltransferase [Gammaproteobacteria bacterium]|nr:acyl-ACP--UDP-N-acetylglucosamine O-acyltransferase [Gammaproteobacteria bacterium]
MSNHIHPTAIIADSARLGQGNHIGPYVVIEDDVVLGDDNRLASHCVIKRYCRMGNGNRVAEHAVIGGDPQDLSFDPATPSRVEIGNDNVLREYVTIHRGSKAGIVTRLGNTNYLMVEVHVAHDCQLADDIVIAPATGIGGHVHIETRAFISGGVMVHQFVRIGRQAMIGGNTKLTQDALPYMITDGVPGRARGLNSVGLRRAGFGREDMRALKQAWRVLFEGHDSLDAILARLRELDSAHCRYLADFIAESKRGFHRADG